MGPTNLVTLGVSESCSSRSQPGISDCGVVEGNCQARPGSLCLEGITGSLAQGAVPSVDFVLTIGTKEDVPEVEEAFQQDKKTIGSKILHRRLEIGPQTGGFELDNARLQIIESMRRARFVDKDCTLQIGSFVVLKYTDSGPVWWKLQKHWTPTILNIHRSPWSLLALLFGWNAHWTIRGFNLRDATVTATTSSKRENLKILQYHKAKNGEDVFLCEEPYLVKSSAPMFQEKVYICASKFVEVDEGVTFNLQSDAKNIKKPYWLSVMKGLVPSPWTLVVIASLSILQGLQTHNTLFSKDNLFLSVNIEGSSVLLDIWRELFTFILVYMFAIVVPIVVSISWLLLHERVPSSGYGVDAPTVALDYVTSSCSPIIPPHREDIVLDDSTNDNPSPSTPPVIADILLQDISSSSIHSRPSPAIEAITTTTSLTVPPVESMLLEDSPCSMEDITQKPSFRPMEDTSSNPSTERPPQVVDTLMKTDTHFGVQDSQAGNDVNSRSARTSMGRPDTEMAITSRTPELENVDLEKQDQFEAVPNASWLDMEPQSALKDNELEPLRKERLTEADQSAPQLSFEQNYPHLIFHPRQLLRDPKLFIASPIAPAKPASAEKEKNKPIVMSISICCSSCVDIIDADFRKVIGIKTADYDIYRGKVTVTGTATQADVLSAARRHFKDAKLFFDDDSNHPSLAARRSGSVEGVERSGSARAEQEKFELHYDREPVPLPGAGVEREQRRGGTEREGEARAREVQATV